MKTYLVETKKGVVMAMSLVTENDWDDPELTYSDIVETRLENAINDGALEDGDYEIREVDYFGDENEYHKFVADMEDKWGKEFVEI